MYEITAHTSVIRAARSEIVPLVPSLAPRLIDTPFAVRDALADSFESRGLNPSMVPEVNYNKVERHIYAGFLIGQMRQLLVDGGGSEAVFKDFATVKHPSRSRRRRLSSFNDCLRATMLSGADQVELNYSDGTDAEHRWLPLATDRYKRLGATALAETPSKWHFNLLRLTAVKIPPLSREGRNLDFAIRSRAIPSFTAEYLKFLTTYHAPTQDRVLAGHALTHVLTTTASLHGFELFTSQADGFSTGFSIYKGTIFQDGTTGCYRVRPSKNPFRKRNPYTRVNDLPNTKIKCPAHAVDAARGETNLETFTHAVVNMAGERGIL